MLERLRELDDENTFATIAPKPDPGGTDPLILTPLELNDRLAAVVSPAGGPNATATSVCWRVRPLMGIFREDAERRELAASSPMQG